MADEVKRDPEAEARLLRRHRHLSISTSSTCGTRSRRGPTSACARPPAYAHRPQGAQRGRDARRLPADRQHRAQELRVRAADRARPVRSRRRPRSCWPRPAIPNGFDAGDLYPWPPYFSTGEAIVNYLGAVGIKTRVRTMERAAFYAALGHARSSRALCMCINAVYGNASSRMSETVPSDGAFAYGGYPDVDDALQAAGARDRPEEARGDAAPDPADPARARRGSRRSTTTSGRAASGRASRTPR